MTDPSAGDTPLFSIVVPTLGRSDELIPLCESLKGQTLTDFEVVAVDQNGDERLSALLAQHGQGLTVHHLRTPGVRGLSRARNTGWRAAKGRYVVFADDDCWYPPSMLEKAAALFSAHDADVVCGRATDESGRSINGRYEAAPQVINRANVWTTSIEWMVFFRRDALVKLEGYDEDIGVGAATPWQAAEGQDILLRALDAGLKLYFDPDLFGHHPELDIKSPDAAMLKKARAYGRGMGFVLRKHGFGPASLVRWIGRPSGAALIYAVKGQPARARYYYTVARGRMEGYLHWAPV